MAFDRKGLIRACRLHGGVARIVVAEVRGSAPREVGAAMLVWPEGSEGTIGGGALEHDLMSRARAMHWPFPPTLSRHALGPDMGQCCGGAVTILTEAYDLARAEALPADFVVRGNGEVPLRLRHLLARARRAGEKIHPQLIDGWMVEPVLRAERAIWIWGAGHVGRSLVSVLAPFPEFAITWVDTDGNRFPDEVPEAVERTVAASLSTLARHAPQDAEHLIVTYSHALDLELCHTLLGRGFGHLGLIGSATKWARFRRRLAQLGHAPASIERIVCPIGDPALGKAPQAVAIGVAARMLRQGPNTDTHATEKRA